MPGNRRGYLPCFNRHVDKIFPIDDFYNEYVFVGKLKVFLFAITDSSNIIILNEKVHAKGGIQRIDPMGNSDDKRLYKQLSWAEGLV